MNQESFLFHQFEPGNNLNLHRWAICDWEAPSHFLTQLTPLLPALLPSCSQCYSHRNQANPPSEPFPPIISCCPWPSIPSFPSLQSENPGRTSSSKHQQPRMQYQSLLGYHTAKTSEHLKSKREVLKNVSVTPLLTQGQMFLT